MASNSPTHALLGFWAYSIIYKDKKPLLSEALIVLVAFIAVWEHFELLRDEIEVLEWWPDNHEKKHIYYDLVGSSYEMKKLISLFITKTEYN